MGRLLREETEHQVVEVWRTGAVTEFRVEGAVHAWHHPQRVLTGLAWDLIAAGPLLRAGGPPASILMLGLAGGTSFRTLRHLLPDARLTAVEIDSRLLGLARRFMDLDALGIEVIEADAYAWLKQNRRRFDVVIDDLYLAGRLDVYRPRGWDETLLQRLFRAVSPGGLLSINLVTGPGHRRQQSHTRGLLRRHAPCVKSLTTPGALNEVLVAGDAAAGRRALDGYDPEFDSWRDRDYWHLIRVRRL